MGIQSRDPEESTLKHYSTGHYNRGAIMKSRAARRFNCLHPDSHLQFQHILASAKLQKEDSPGPRSGELSDEETNMMRNTFLTRATEEDRLQDEVRKKTRLRKRITWSPTLVEVKNLLDPATSIDHLESEE